MNDLDYEKFLMSNECNWMKKEEHNDWRAIWKIIKGFVNEDINNKKYLPLAIAIEKWGYSLMRLRNAEAEHGNPDILNYEIGRLFD